MTQTAWDVGGDVRQALASIVRDPQLGTAVLADPHVMANLLKDLLPDLPRESALLVAAAQCDLTGVLTGHLDQGLDLRTSSRLASGWFAERMPFADDACAWVVGELAIALGADIGQARTFLETIPAAPEYLLGPSSTSWASGLGAPEDAAAGTILGWGG